MPFLSEPSREALGRLASDESRDAVPTPLNRVASIRSLALSLDRDAAVISAIREALAGGASWDAIAEAAQLKPAAAKWRWQGTDAEITARHAAGRQRSARPSSVPTELPGVSVAEAARALGVTAQAIYLQVTRGKLRSETVVLEDGRKYKRVFLPEET